MIPSAHGHLFTSLFFFGFIALSLGLTYWAMRRARDATGFFVAGRRLTGWQNGLAISGDYMSAASFLGIAGLVSLFGYDGLLYSFGFIVGWVVIVLLVAEPLRNSGKYTLSDVMAFRLRARSGCFTCWPSLLERAPSHRCYFPFNRTPPSSWSGFSWWFTCCSAEWSQLPMCRSSKQCLCWALRFF
jgi:hypothetical protein